MAVNVDGSVSVFQGRLMSPREAAEATRGRGIAAEYTSKWHLCGDVNEQLFALCAAGSPPGFAVGSFKTPGGAVFASFILQMKNQQARFLLPLSTEKCIRFLEQAERTGLCLSLGRNGAEQAMLAPFAVEDMLEPLRRHAKLLSRLPRDLTAEDLRFAGQQLMSFDGAPSIMGEYALDGISLTVVLDNM
ncbi:hypothetical protein [Rugamonas sp.]|uniref:hypothetical protein n=1 Tax=Rugamonas sp. TaxID=1926287 RepID=UPI0025F9B076|nr:hypothetical protein [Rugamonas sp.]